MRARNLFASHFISTSLLAAQLLLIFFVSNSSLCHATALTSASKNGREALEIIIGDVPPIAPAYPPNGDVSLCPPPPPPPEPICPSPTPTPPPPPPPPPKIVHSPPKLKPTPSPPPKVHVPPKHTPSPSPPIPNYLLASELSVIKRFQKTITSDPFGKTKTWVGKDVCKYDGIICYKNKVVSINFNGFNFNGNNLSLKNFIEKIKTLVIVHLNSNNFTGDVPYEISSDKQPKLFELDLSNNNFKGSFPKAVLGATNLTYLDLRFNQFTGPVDPQVFTLNLDVLFLNNNGFSGTIPESLGRTDALFLTLANNKFIGGIPKSIGNARGNLLEVLFLNNQLSGCLPYEIGLLKLATVFDASKNKLTGPIPQSFGCLKNMELLNLTENLLYGEVPETLCKLNNLEKLTLSYNYFTQVGPECRKLIAENVLDVSMNCIIDADNQRKPDECEAFFLKRYICPDMKTLIHHVPCDIHKLSSKQNSVGRAQRAGARARSTTYVAINKPHL
ncbi:hypothetical protein K7X08_017449 [Anisodus acutangulus]|uniref:Uncharacterized protein n=1 Tax=Anisodus acutangulus TaxID=402998 RepID=A0A9Q1LTT1_9SOLA|nr:hypothetical protein K7X08_017449 [Anisodus acutangulus]